MKNASYYLDNYDIVAFPNLSLEFNISPIAFNIFGLDITWYGILISFGILLALCYCLRESKMKNFGLDGDRVIDTVFVGLIAAIAGARLYFIMLDPETGIADFFKTRDGGLAIYGGIIGALLFGGIVAKLRKVRLMPLFDVASMGLLIGQSVGRWGNFINKEAFGSQTTLPWGMASGSIQSALNAFPGEPPRLAHPCFLYESLWCIIGFVLLHLYVNRRKYDGQIFIMYIAWYGTGRFFIEGLRMDSLYIGELRASQVLSAVLVLTAVTLLLVLGSKYKRGDMPPLYRDTDESKALLEKASMPPKKKEKKTNAS